MNRYTVKPGIGFWMLVDSTTGEQVADIVDRKQARKVCSLLNGTRHVEELPRPLPAEQMRLWPTAPAPPRPP